MAGKKLRVLTVVDTFSRYVPVLDAKFIYRGEDVVATLDRVCRQTGYPKTIRVDQGSGLVARDMDLWALASLRLMPSSCVEQLIPPDQLLLPPYIQWPVLRRMPEYPPVSDACRCDRKAEGMGSILQRGLATWRDRQQSPDHADGTRGPRPEQSRKTPAFVGPTLGERIIGILHGVLLTSSSATL